MNDFNSNNINLQSQYVGAMPPLPKPEPKPAREFTTLERAFAWISFIAGYLFCRAFPVGGSPFGGFLFVTLLFVVTAAILKLKGCKLAALPMTLAISAIAISASLIISNNTFIYFFAYSYALAVYCYFIYSVAGTSLRSGFTDFIAIDFFKAIFLSPFYAFGQLFRGMFSAKAKKGGKVVSRALLGIALAILPTAIVLGLLSYDANFYEIICKIFDFSFYDVFSHILSLGFAIPIGMYVFGLFISTSDNMYHDVMTEEGCKDAYRKMKIAPTITIMVAAIPLLLVYVIFFISQIDYYISGFSGVLPMNISYAEYAREGFFQLCIVSVINLVVILLAVMFMKRKTEQPALPLKILTVIYSVFTLILISTAVAKMVMYIDYYGLTHKRVYATWFMFLLALVFIIIAIKQFVPSFKSIVASLVVCVVLFAGLSLSNIDSHIASYNVNRYLNGTLQDIDVYTMYELGDAAIPDMVRLYEVMKEKEANSALSSAESYEYRALKSALESRALEAKYDESGIFAFNIPSARAKNALKESGFLQ